MKNRIPGVLVFLFLAGTAGIGTAITSPKVPTPPRPQIAVITPPDTTKQYAACIAQVGNDYRRVRQEYASDNFALLLTAVRKSLALLGAASPELTSEYLQAIVVQDETRALALCKSQYF